MSLGKLFQIRDALRCTEVVSQYLDLAGGIDRAWLFLRLYGISLRVYKDHLTLTRKEEVLL